MRVSFGASAADILLAGVGGLYDTVDFRTRLTPPAVFTIADLQDQSPPSAITQWLQPTLILSGPAGRKVFAPYGESEGGTGIAFVGALGFIFGAGFLFGRLTSRR